MKKILSVIMSVLVLCTTVPVSAATDDISVYIDDELTVLTDSDGIVVRPFIQNGTTYVPLRGISEALDCDVIWDGNNKTILIYKEMQSDNSVFRNSSDDIKLYVDNELTELKDANGTVVKPFIKDGTTYVPLRGVSQALGCWVRWDGQTKTVSVYMNTCPPDGVTLSENKPYELGAGEAYYESDGKKLNIDNVDYTNAIGFYDWWDKSAYFNLDGKYDLMTMTIGSTGNFDDEKRIEFIVDGKIVDTHIIGANSGAEEISIDLNKGLQLKILSTSKHFGMGNIIFWGE